MSELSPQDIVVAKHECIELVTRYFRHYDRREYPELYALMTPDSVWNRPDGPARFGPELEAAMARRPDSWAVVHLLTNLFADLVDEGRVKVHGMMAVIRDDNGRLAPPPARIAPPHSVIEFSVLCRKAGANWRIVKIDVQHLFIKA